MEYFSKVTTAFRLDKVTIVTFKLMILMFGFLLYTLLVVIIINYLLFLLRVNIESNIDVNINGIYNGNQLQLQH